MKRHFAAGLLALAVTAALPLAAQETPQDPPATPTQDMPQDPPATPAQDTSQDPPAAARQSRDQPAAPQMTPEMQAMMEAWQKAGTPGAQHKQLNDQFAGNWTVKMTMWMDPSAPSMEETGTATTTSVFGGRQLRQEFSGQFMGQPYQGFGHVGYDNTRGKYTSSWIDNMSTGAMMMDGEYDAATKTYTFRGEMADPTKNGQMIPMRETVRVVDADHHVMEMYEPKDGKEVKTMSIEYARVK